MAKKINEIEHVAQQIAQHIDTVPTYRRVAHSGNARYLSVTKQLPLGWNLVEITATQIADNIVTLKVVKIR